MEVTFEESRAHLGVETQRQWSDAAIARSTPSLLGLFSVVALWANKLQQQQQLSTSWYQKQQPTFCDAIAAVRSSIWQQNHFSISDPEQDIVIIPKPFFDQIVSLLSRAA